MCYRKQHNIPHSFRPLQLPVSDDLAVGGKKLSCDVLINHSNLSKV